MSQRILSISGLRGVVGDGLDPEYIVQFAAALGTMIDGGKVILSRDGRSTGLWIRDAVVSALQATGCDVIDAGIASTPTCGVLVKHYHAQAGLQVTASHNPVQWNGLKPFSPEGSVFDQETGDRFLKLLNGREFNYRSWSEMGHVEMLQDSWRSHFDKILSLIDIESIRSRKFKVVLDCNHGAGAVLGPLLLNELGCEVSLIGGTPDGQFEHTPEPTEENCRSVGEAIVAAGADIGFVQDPDADRLAIIDEKGTYIGEELTLALCVDHVLPQRPGPVVVNGSTSRVTADIAEKHGCDFSRSYVGEANVVAHMREVQAVIGGEGNGGLIDPKIGWVRDSFLAMAYVLEHLSERTLSLSEWVASLPCYAIIKDKIECAPEAVPVAAAALKKAFPDAQVSEGDGLRLDWEKSWVQVRASNTEPIMRIIAEAPEATAAQDLIRRSKSAIMAAFG
ncbi:Phosphoglucosamine mutase [Polystyrenella longa]|uniref:Phosphoglucosamine mutase n=1 Tax=Polystyrenella longa TaxID=2528007 RepID=A0A518CPU8_9PLAN|nr:phosphoglucosamine mutase [Polystyrenella longa]QDU81242.1 Phosphoglucosamine mutase [Polystyrenella longa]